MAGGLTQAVLTALQRYPTLDPRAVLSVAQQEGLSGGVGDGGHAFGPFQENNAGGVLTGRFPGMSREQLQQWAISPEGINDALSRINKVAGGLKGNAAINAIVSGFERPANPGREIAGAQAAYGGQPAGQTRQLTSARPGIGALLGGAQQGASMGGGADAARNALMSFVMNSSQAIASGKTPPAQDPAQLLQFLQAAQGQGGATQGTQGIAGAPGGSQGGAAGVVQAAKGYLGVPYRWGGNDPHKGLDCSSFLQQAFGQVGVKLPRTTTDQFHTGQPVQLNQLQPGDAVFTEPGRGPNKGPGHVGLYIGGGRVQESPHTGTVNSVISLKAFLGGGFVGARRYAA